MLNARKFFIWMDNLTLVQWNAWRTLRLHKKEKIFDQEINEDDLEEKEEFV